MNVTPDLRERFVSAVARLDNATTDAEVLTDANVNQQLREWLDSGAAPLPWAKPATEVTADEWFFITTLYGEMTLDGQRTHIRSFYPSLFVAGAGRDVRGFLPSMAEYAGLRSNWMKKRLAKMGAILRARGITMSDYVHQLRTVDESATPSNPMVAVDTIVRDHGATGWKTLSVFVRDCVGGNCFPIDSRVAKELALARLPVDERLLVSPSLDCGRNPRQLARMFYGAGGEVPPSPLKGLSLPD